MYIERAREREREREREIIYIICNVLHVHVTHVTSIICCISDPI